MMKTVFVTIALLLHQKLLQSLDVVLQHQLSVIFRIKYIFFTDQREQNDALKNNVWPFTDSKVSLHKYIYHYSADLDFWWRPLLSNGCIASFPISASEILQTPT